MSDGQISLVGGFELRNCVATGNATQIWEVTEQGGTVPFAMKLLLPKALKDAEEKSVLKHEFKVGASLDNPCMLRFHKIELTRDHGFFIMDYFRAPSLKAQLSTNLPETQSRLKRIAEALCQAYAHMHDKGWLHRDIKPENILVNKSGEVRVIDFSLSCRIAGALGKMLGGSKTIQGTRTYIPPEIILKKIPTIQSDIYSLGVTLYEVVTGSPPFAGMNPNDLLKRHLSEVPGSPSLYNSNVTPELDAVILKMLAKKPKDRYADMKELATAIRLLKFFKEDPLELHEKKVREAKHNATMSVDKRLDSRADADRTAMGVAAPAKHTKSKPKTAPIGAIEPVRKDKPAAGAGSSPAMPAVAPGMMPPMGYGMPQPMMPPMGYGMPPQPMMPPMGYGMPQPMMPPGMNPMMPGQPMMPPQMPPQMVPQQPMMPPAGYGQPVAPQPAMPQPVPVSQPPVVQQPPAQPVAAAPQNAPAQPAPAAQPAKSVLLPLERRSAPLPPKNPGGDEGLEFMTELPDIL